MSFHTATPQEMEDFDLWRERKGLRNKNQSEEFHKWLRTSDAQRARERLEIRERNEQERNQRIQNNTSRTSRRRFSDLQEDRKVASPVEQLSVEGEFPRDPNIWSKATYVFTNAYDLHVVDPDTGEDNLVIPAGQPYYQDVYGLVILGSPSRVTLSRYPHLQQLNEADI
ncbi:MAG: hypothetical protein Sylvanvirus10_4 [Sylvanvirus sp.]|uniref:Uncharacterized protein n=1 Tax=Sylvanvirus sp. TaxID=2487774 RepID=A0A3G5AHX2_9VIRU|nr:MAG: hypothetical protein Sylvanvirus10_4 [Sylvanvirus sp.]